VTPNSARVQRHRERQKAGTLMALVEMPYSLTANLIALGLLSDEDSFDLRKRGEALKPILMAWLKKTNP